jgi:hypothetical protein
MACEAGWWIAEPERLVLVSRKGVVQREIALRTTYVVAFSATHALSVEEDGSELVDLRTGKVKRRKLRLNARAACLVGSIAAVASENEVVAWDLRADALIWRRAALDEVVAFDGKRVAYAANPSRALAIADAVPRARAKTQACPRLTALCYLADGTLASAHGEAGVRIGATTIALDADRIVGGPGRIAVRSKGRVHVIDGARSRDVGAAEVFAFDGDRVLLVGDDVALSGKDS